MGARKIAAALLLTAACAGPHPTVDDVSVGSSPQPGRVRVQARVRNRSGGRGQVEVQIRLRESRSGRVVQAEQQLELAPHAETRLVTDVEAPSGDYRAEVSAEYPPK